MNCRVEPPSANMLGSKSDLQKPLVVTMLAPASQCNQNCPRCYLTEVRREPVNSFTLTPDHFARAIEELSDSGINILTVCFQGYEVTLPGSWPYLDAVFQEAKEREIRRSFLTNGMRLHTYAESIIAHDPSRIGVSLDGADQETNDRHRGLAGAFKRTLKSLDLFLEEAPDFRDRILVTSVLYGQENAHSLLEMPKLLAAKGLTKWALGLEITSDDFGHVLHALTLDRLSEFLTACDIESAKHGISFFVGDEFGLIDGEIADLHFVKRLPPSSVDFLRILPSGHIYVGNESMKQVASPTDPKWRPNEESIIAYLAKLGLPLNETDLDQDVALVQNSDFVRDDKNANIPL